MDSIFKYHRNWNFCCFSAAPRKVKVIKEEDNTYSFSFPWARNETMCVNLTTYDKKEKKLTGAFKVIEGGLSRKIDFNIQQANMFFGIPDGFHHGTWTLYRGERKDL